MVWWPKRNNLLSQLQEKGTITFNLLLQLQQAVEQCLSRGWATWDVNVYWNDAVTPTDYGVGIVVVPAPVGTAAHGDYLPYI